MSQGQYIPKKKSSPCCIGCIVVLGLLIVLGIAIGIFSYRFAKDNFAIVDVTAVADPAPETKADVLLPEQVSDFTRRTLNTNFTKPTTFTDGTTSGVAFAEYVDSKHNYITVIALPTADAQNIRTRPNGAPVFSGRINNNSSQYGVSFKDFITSGGSTSLTWQKPHWTFMIQTTSTLEQQFVKDFKPGSATATTEESATSNTQTTSPNP